MAKYKVKIVNDDGSEEEVEIPEKIHRAMAGIARAEIEKWADEQKAKSRDDDTDSWWSLGGDEDNDDDSE